MRAAPYNAIGCAVSASRPAKTGIRENTPLFSFRWVPVSRSITWITILVAAFGLTLAGAASFAQTPPATPDSVAGPVVAPTPRPTPKPPSGKAKSDSIYATEITVDITGATVVDRSGRRQHLTKGLLPPETPGNIHQLEDLTDLPNAGNRDIRRENVIHLTSDLVVAEDEVIRGDVVCVFGGQVDIKGEVTGSAVSVFGSVNVDGSVGQDAVAPFGQVHIGPSGSVRKDVVASDIVKEPGGRIGGTRQEILINIFGRPWGVSRLVYPTTLTALVAFNILFWMFLVLLAHALAARNVAKVKDRVQRSFFKSFFMGLLAQILAIPATLLLLVTIVGIPVVIFLVPLMIAAAIVLSQAAMGLLVGEKIDQNVGAVLKTPLARTLTGFLVLQSLSIVAVGAMWAAGSQAGAGFLRLVAIALFAMTLLLAYVVVTVGSGAVVMTRFGTRPKDIPPAPPTEPSHPDTDSHARRTPTPLPHPDSGTSDTAPVAG